MKAHQRIIREKKEREHRNKPKDPLFGSWWEDNHRDTDIKKAEIKEITYQEAKPIILEYEWLGTMGTTQYHYGIYFNGECGGVVCFGYFQAPMGYKKYVGEKYAKKGIQLSRGACVWWAHEHSASKLISESLKIMNRKGFKYVVAFSDSDAGEIGTVYQATNWYYIGLGDGGGNCDLFYKGSNAVYINSRDYYSKFGKALKKNEAERFCNKHDDFYYRFAEPKSRYIYLLGTKKEKKEMMKVLEPRIKPYPKRMGERYKQL